MPAMPRSVFHPLLLACLALWAGVAAAAAESKSSSPSTELRIISYNILGGDDTGGSGPNAWSGRRDLVAALLRQQRPDVISLQKAARSSLDDLHRALPGYGEAGVGRDDGKAGGEYAAILYRLDRFEAQDSGTFWLSETPAVAGTAGWGARQPRVCSWVRLVDKTSRVTFYVFNTHLDPSNAAVRDRSAALIQNRIKARAQLDPFILTGDLNSPESSTTLRILKGPPDFDPATAARLEPPPLRDTFRLIHPDESQVSTRHQFTGSPSGQKVDYILVPPAIEVLAAGIVRDRIEGRYPSDHFPVVATLRLPAAR